MTERPEKDRVKDGPSMTKEQWFGCAALCAVLTVVLFGWVAFQVLFQFGMHSVDGANVARSGAALLTFGAAATTFFIVLYRSKITEEQVTQAKRQNDSKDEAELALLLEKAHGLLSNNSTETLEDDTKNALQKRSLALGLLETIATAENDRYAALALELTIDQIVSIHSTGGPTFHRHISQVHRIFDRALERGRTLTRNTVLDFDTQETGSFNATRTFPFSVFSSLPPVIVRAADVVFFDSAVVAFNQGMPWWFRNCRISAPMFEPYIQYYDGRIEYSEISATHLIELGQKSQFAYRAKNLTFVSCALTNTTVYDPRVFDAYIFKSCYYLESKPPKFSDDIPGDAVKHIRSKKLDIYEAPDVTTKERIGE